jgi:hypothetical protein
MWNYFSSKLRSIKPSVKEVDIPATKFNWCLFESNNTEGSGVFFSSFEPGIKDYKGGTLYIVPEEYMKRKEYMKLGSKRRFTAYNARIAILEYYGVIADYKPKTYYEDDCFSY